MIHQAAFVAVAGSAPVEVTNIGERNELRRNYPLTVRARGVRGCCD